ncbi:MAG: pantoate--beta-alanine ligase [Arenicellales bacterium]
MTTLLDTPQQASRWCQRQRDTGKSIGYVPTMGALHDGHLSLVRRSVSENDITCVSIFINPLQFNNPEDLESYPRSMESDLVMLQEAGCDMVYTGSLETFFPDQTSSLENSVPVEPVKLRGLEADCRPGHLEGVKAIVERLFATVGQCSAYFGEKDFQQTLLVKDIANRHGEIDVVVCPTVRETSGLAMSSRNQRLSTAALELASCLYQALVEADNAWRQGERNPLRLEQLMQDKLDRPGIEIEYATVRDPLNWTIDTPTHLNDSAQALIAAYIDGVRLIDNLALGSCGCSES